MVIVAASVQADACQDDGCNSMQLCQHCCQFARAVDTGQSLRFDCLFNDFKLDDVIMRWFAVVLCRTHV